MASTIKMPPKQQTNEKWWNHGQDKAARSCHRYLIQVDRQTKSSFDDKATAEKVAKAIKKAHPVVRGEVSSAVCLFSRWCCLHSPQGVPPRALRGILR